MKRRTMIAGLAGLPLLASGPRAATPKPYRIALIAGVRDGPRWSAGIKIAMDDGWKTYWRNPGDAGIPPSFDWQRSQNLADVVVQFPLPTRHRDVSGEAIGYFREVVFPLVVTPEDAAKPVSLRLDMFFGVCKEVCIPAQAAIDLQLDQAAATADDRQLVMLWQQKVPQPQEVVSSVSFAEDGQGPLLSFTLNRPVDDILIEDGSGAYFRAPQFSDGNRRAQVAVGNLKSIDTLHGSDVRLTFDVGGLGLEQVLKLP